LKYNRSIQPIACDQIGGMEMSLDSPPVSPRVSADKISLNFNLGWNRVKPSISSSRENPPQTSDLRKVFDGLLHQLEEKEKELENERIKLEKERQEMIQRMQKMEQEFRQRPRDLRHDSRRVSERESLSIPELKDGITFANEIMKRTFEGTLKEKHLQKVALFFESKENRKIFIDGLNRRRGEHSQLATEKAFTSLSEVIRLAVERSDQQEDYKCCFQLMHMAATYYRKDDTGFVFVQSTLKDFATWKKAGFWEQTFCDEILEERRKLVSVNWADLSNSEKLDFEEEERNTAFGLLSTFSHQMLSFGVSKRNTEDFIKKWSLIHGLTREQISMLQVFIFVFYFSIVF